MSIRDHFAPRAAEQAEERRDGMAAPQELFERRIKTREVLDWMERRAPKTPAPELSPPDGAAREQAEQENSRLPRQMRRRFYARSEKGREDFRTAHDFGRDAGDTERDR